MANCDVTIAQVRALSGANTDLISDADIQILIDEAKAATKTLFQIEYEPTITIETLTGDFKDQIMVDEYFPLTTLELRNGDTTMDLDNVYTHTYEGLIEIFGDNIVDSQFTSRFSGFDLDIKIKYLYGAIEKDNDIQTTSTAILTKGTSVTLPVLSSTGFLVGEFIYVEDMNRRREVAEILSIPNGTSIEVVTLIYTYEDSALITNSKCNALIERFLQYESAIAVATNATGSTFEFAASYQLPELSVVKGVPFTHWRESFAQLIKQRDQIKKRIEGMLSTVV